MLRPHHDPGPRAVESGKPNVEDWGTAVAGYSSDITRALVLGEAGEEFRRRYSIVLEILRTAEERIRVGMTWAEAFDLGRGMAEAAGESEHYGRGLGHEVGLAIHERPWLRGDQQNVLADGIEFSLESGLHVPGWGGIRIEDLVVLREGRPLVLTCSPKALQAVTT